MSGNFTEIFEALRPFDKGHTEHFFALVAYAPPEVTAALDDIRRRYDPAFKEGILPHVTMKRPAILPDAALLPALSQSIRQAVQTISPFQIELSGYGIFRNSDKNVVFVKVQEEKPFCRLHTEIGEALKKVLPGGGLDKYEGEAYHPHLTIGNNLSDLELAVMQYELDSGSYRLNFTFELSEVALLSQPPRLSWETVDNYHFGP